MNFPLHRHSPFSWSVPRERGVRASEFVLVARRKDRIDALVKDITSLGGSAVGYRTDVTKRGDVEALVKGANDKHG